MATRAEQYAKWIVDNADKRGTPEFDTVVKAYQAARAEEKPQTIASNPVADVAGGALAGAGDIGATLVSGYNSMPSNLYTRMGYKPQTRSEIVGDIEKTTRDMGADPNSLTYKGSRIASNVAGTSGLGPAMAPAVGAAARSVPFLAKYAPAAAETVKTAGFGPSSLGARAFGGALTGGAAAGLVDPENAATGAAIGAALPVSTKALGALYSHTVGGIGTGTGAQSVKNAYAYGKAGGQELKDFRASMRGQTPMDTVLRRAKDAVKTVAEKRSIGYAVEKAGWDDATKTVDFAPIQQEYDDLVSMFKQKGHWAIGKDARAKLKEVGSTIKEWADDPSMRTVADMDALKKRLDSLFVPTGSRQVKMIVTRAKNAVKNEIVKQSPSYAKAMDEASESFALQKQIETALSLGDRASADTALRKLQSLTRNNVNTNYGNRLELMKALEDESGKNLMPAITGQAMNTITPRGLGKLAASANIGAGWFNPWLLTMLPFQSPRLVGETSAMAGQLAGAVDPNLLSGAIRQGLLQVGQD